MRYRNTPRWLNESDMRSVMDKLKRNFGRSGKDKIFSRFINDLQEYNNDEAFYDEENRTGNRPSAEIVFEKGAYQTLDDIEYLYELVTALKY